MTVAPEPLPPRPLRHPALRTVLLDEDPISRHVVAEAFERDSHFELIAALNPFDPREAQDSCSLATVAGEPPPAEVAVLCLTPSPDVLRRVSELSSAGVGVLMVGANWAGIDVVRAFGAGALGCVLKSARPADILTAALSVGTGHMVLSPELRVYYPPDPWETEWLARPSSDAAVVPVAVPEALIGTLTGREHQVLLALAEGSTTAEVAQQLGVSKATVKSHVSHALTKLGARNRVEAVLMVRNAEPQPLPGR